MKSVFIIISMSAVLIMLSTVSDAVRLPEPVSDADYYNNGIFSREKVKLGNLLFFDKILSGNRNISCATCHHAFTDTGDGLSLPIGEGGKGLGVTRDTGTGADAVYERVPRNAPHIFNLGAREFQLMFYDGRVEVDPAQPSGFKNPVGDDLPLGLDNVLAVQAMFPVTSPAEMAGQPGENSIADAAAAGNLPGPGGVWEQLAGRLRNNEEYVNLFQAAYPEIASASDITFVHAANAIAAFEASAFRADNSPFDRYLRGDRSSLSMRAYRGLKLFYGSAHCARCHSGKFQTDQGFHAIAVPQIGPGKGDNAPGYNDGHDDFGREGVTENPEDRCRFRTPSLRNSALTAPYGHCGAYNSLEAMVKHHLDPYKSLLNYDKNQAVLPSREDLDALDFIVINDPTRLKAIAMLNELPEYSLDENDIADIVEFLRALTDPESIDLRNIVPHRVPSGLSMSE